jgi:hypothetical protein
MTILQFANNATTTLAQPITGVDTTIYVAAGTGSLFPQPIAGYNFLATIYNTSSTLDEVVLVTARSGDQLTVVRAQEGTIASTWIVGDTFGMYPTKGTMEKLVQNDQLQKGTYTVVQAAGTANALTCVVSSDLTSVPDGMTLVVKPLFTNSGATTLQVTMGSTFIPAVPIVKGPNLALESTDIPSAGYPVQLIYSALYGAWVMQMPSTLISPPVPPTYTVQYLAIGGGGGGGSSGNPQAGGGGAGGYTQNYFTALSGTVLGISIGGGGSTNANGTDTSVTGVVTVSGGGYGGNPEQNGGNGGSGGGGGARAAFGYGITGQGYNGGYGDFDSGAGGGGAGGGGGNAGDGGGFPNRYGGVGGTGSSSAINGSTVVRAGGGGGGGVDVAGNGGSGGGGRGAQNPYSGQGVGFPATAGLVNTGGGGGGGTIGYAGANGGSGVVILVMPTSSYTGTTTGSPTVFTSGSNTVLTYTSSGTYTA